MKKSNSIKFLQETHFLPLSVLVLFQSTKIGPEEQKIPRQPPPKTAALPAHQKLAAFSTGS